MTYNPEESRVAVGRRAARAILIDDRDRLVLIKRTKPGQAPYWTAPGGGVDDTDVSVEAALRRELAEELGAEAAGASWMLVQLALGCRCGGAALLCGPADQAG